jgi:hypothetical protein
MEFDRIQYNPDGSMTAYSKDGRSYTFGASEPKPKVVSDILEVCSNDPDEWKKKEAVLEGLIFPNVNHEAKHDEGKLQLRLVPPQIIRDIAEVRMYGNEKYKDPDNWKTVEKWRYVDALFRHFLLYLEDPEGVDEESGIKHYKHMACNMAFICAMEAKEDKNG